MALNGTLVNQTAIKSNGDAFLQIFTYEPFLISNMCPDSIQGCDLLAGEWGSIGSTLFWKYHLDGSECVAKEVVAAVDKENKLVCFNVVDGTLLDLYKILLLTINVDTTGEQHLVTWTLTYEKLNETVADPNNLMEFCLSVTKDIDTYQYGI